MEKIYVVYEGSIDLGDPDWGGGCDKMVAIYPMEDIARHHLELWVSKMLPIIDSWNDAVSEKLKRRVEKGLDEEYHFDPWIPKPNNEDERERAFVRDDEEVYCYYREYDVLQEVRLE